MLRGGEGGSGSEAPSSGSPAVLTWMKFCEVGFTEESHGIQFRAKKLVKYFKNKRGSMEYRYIDPVYASSLLGSSINNVTSFLQYFFNLYSHSSLSPHFFVPLPSPLGWHHLWMAPWRTWEREARVNMSILPWKLAIDHRKKFNHHLVRENYW